MNLSLETIIAIYEPGYRIEDIEFIGSMNGVYSCCWEDFWSMADREYDPELLAVDLIIVFCDGTKLLRNLTKGQERWEYIKNPRFPPYIPPLRQNKVRRIFGDCKPEFLVRLADINTG